MKISPVLAVGHLLTAVGPAGGAGGFTGGVVIVPLAHEVSPVDPTRVLAPAPWTAIAEMVGLLAPATRPSVITILPSIGLAVVDTKYGLSAPPASTTKSKIFPLALINCVLPTVMVNCLLPGPKEGTGSVNIRLTLYDPAGTGMV